MSRPEHLAPPEIFYNESEASKYTANSRIQEIQAVMTERCIELLALPCSASDPSRAKPSYLLDIGCGSGLSGELLSEEGHVWAGVDVSASMLGLPYYLDQSVPFLTFDTEVAIERESEGDLFLQDIGQGFGFRPGSFDGAISVSVIQWLCNADSSAHSPPVRLARFFNTLFASLARGARAVFQFYPESDDQVSFIMQFATRAGFGGGLVVDYPNSKKAKKFYLCLIAGNADQAQALPTPKGVGLGEEAEEGTVRYERTRDRKSGKRKSDKSRKQLKSNRQWILEKKDLYRKKGKEGLPTDSQYTGRKRRVKF